MPAPRIHGIVETCLYSDDLPRAVHFYRDHLGLRLLESSDRLCVLGVADKQVLLLFHRGETLTPTETPGGLIPPHGGSGPLHIAFAISAGEFAAWEKHLAAQGMPVESKVNWPSGAQSLFFRDPDGHLVELGTPGLWEVY